MSNQDQTKEKKNEILQAATKLLASQGLQALTFENVANQADLSRQLVRYYYKDAESLMIDLADHLSDQYREALVLGIVELGKVRRLDWFLDYFFDLSEVTSMPSDLEVYDALIAFSVGSLPLRGRMRLQYQTLGKVMAHELAIAHPELKGHSCEELSFLFVSAMHAHWSFVASLGYSREHSLLARNAFGRLIESYVKEAPSSPTIPNPWGHED